MPLVSLKLVLYRKRGTDIRRLSGEYDFSMLNSVIAELWGTAPRFMTIQYEDDEGDMVRVGSEREWQECLRIYRETSAGSAKAVVPLKLHVRKATKKDRNGRPRSAEVPSAASPELDSEDEGLATESTPQVPVIVPTLSLKCSTVESPKTPERLPEISLSKSLQSGGSERPSQTRTPLSPAQALPAQEQQPEPPKRPSSAKACPGAESGLAALRVLSLLFNCDAVAELANPCSTAPFLGSIVQVGFTAEEAHVDIDQQRLLREVIARGNFLMDRHRHDQAWELLLAALEVYPRNSILLYNAACVNALMYHQARALQLLKEAVDAGYNDARHMLNDEDLENVRQTPEFAALYERMTGVKVPEPALQRSRSSPVPPARAEEMDPPTAVPENLSPASSSENLSEGFVLLSKSRSPSDLAAPAPSPASPAHPVSPAAAVPVPEAAPQAPSVPVPAAATVAPFPSAPQPTVTFAEPAAPPQPTVSATRTISPEVRQLTAIFPSLEVETAATILSQCGNRVQRAVAIILGDN